MCDDTCKCKEETKRTRYLIGAFLIVLSMYGLENHIEYSGWVMFIGIICL